MPRKNSGRTVSKHFMLSGFSSEEKVTLGFKIQNLGGLCMENEVSYFSNNAFFYSFAKILQNTEY